MLAGASVLAVSRTLTPDARGFGTHEQLGLPACAFFAWTGIPCPTCGLTTSFAHCARGELSAAFEAHALGPLLFLGVAAIVPLGMWACVGKSLPQLSSARLSRLGLIVLTSLLSYWLLRVSMRFL
jgi:hypothetical protein